MVFADRWGGMIHPRHQRLSARETVERADKVNDAGDDATEQRYENDLFSMQLT
ncbi:MAG: hypothetical protein WAK55_11475 [Xanthobacteraceae bacterium]|jgi:hypothetical protein